MGILLTTIIAIVAIPFIWISGLLSPNTELIKIQTELTTLKQQLSEPVNFTIEELKEFSDRVVKAQKAIKEGRLGADNFLLIAGRSYRLSGSGITASASSVGLSSFTLPVSSQKITMSDFGTIGYATLEPGNNDRKEIISFEGVTQNSDGTATLTNVSRGLGFNTPYTASTTLQKAHSGGSTIIISNPPQVYNKFTSKDNDETINNIWTFGSTTPPRYDANVTVSGNQFVSFNQLNATAIAGAGTSTEAALGLVRLATQAETATGTASSTTGAPLVIKNSTATSTYDVNLAGNRIPVTNASGQINANFIATSSSYMWTASTTFSGNTFFNNGTTSFSGITNFTNFASSSYNYFGVDSSGLDTYAIQLDPTPAAYAVGMKIAFRPSATSTLASTINVNNLGAKSIKRNNGSDTNTGDIRTNIIANLIYDGTNFQLQNPQSTTVEFATTQVFNGGTLPLGIWTDLPLGGFIGTTTSTVLLRVQVNSNTGTTTVSFRKNGFTGNMTTAGSAGTVIINDDRADSAYVVVPTDGEGIVEWRCDGACGGSAPTINIESYWNK